MSNFSRLSMIGAVVLLALMHAKHGFAGAGVTIEEVRKEFGDVNAPREFNLGLMPERLLPLQIVSAVSDPKAPEVIRALVRAGARIDAIGPNGNAAIHTAAWRNAAENIRMLAKLGADVNLKNRNGRTALLVAIDFGKLEAVEALLDSGADPNIADDKGNTAVHLAVKMNDKAVALKILPLLKRHGADVDARNKEGDTPLQRIAATPSADDAPIVRWLLASGARPDVRDKYGDTPMHQIAGQQTSNRNQLVPLLAALEEAGAPVDAQNNQGETPLHLAVFQDCYLGVEPVITQWLLEHGADPDIKSRAGASPRDTVSSPALHCGQRMRKIFESRPAKSARKPHTAGTSDNSADMRRLDSLISKYLKNVDEMGRKYQRVKERAVKARGFSGLTTREVVQSRQHDFAVFRDSALELLVALEDAKSIIWEAVQDKIDVDKEDVDAAVTRRLGKRLSKEGITLLKAQIAWADAYHNVFTLLDQHWGTWSVDEGRQMIIASNSSLKNKLKKEMQAINELEAFMSRVNK